MKRDPGVGATDELNLRVSVATLVRVVFTHPGKEGRILALERKATFLEQEQRVIVKAQPFGGAIRINDVPLLDEITGGFHFDSERSRAEQDFRIFIRTSTWDAVKVFCLEQFQASEEAALETSPIRELAEEFEDSLRVQLHPDQYVYKPLWTVVENDPSPTANIHVEQQPTVRVYRVFETQIIAPELCQHITRNSESYSNQSLQDRALEDKQAGGTGRANACMVVPLESLYRFYASRSLEQRNAAAFFMETSLEKNSIALLEGIPTTQFQYIKAGEITGDK